jgi:hypothetical protein
MKTTLVLPDPLVKRLRREAARRGTTLSAVVESALRAYLDRKLAARKLPNLPSFDGGRALAPVADREALYRAMEGR